MKCPCCKATIVHSYQNLGLLELIPESDYDKQKIKLIKLINSVKDLNSKSLNSINEKRKYLKDQIEVLKNTINRESNIFIDLIRANQNNLMDEANDLNDIVVSNIEKILKTIILTKDTFDETINDLSIKKTRIEENELNEEQMTNLNELLDKMTLSTNEAFKQIEKIEINFNFDIRDNINSKTGEMGEINCMDKEVFH
jgi:hypothetical protein